MRLLLTFSRAYPLQSVLVLLALLLAGVAEGFGVSALLPLLSSVVSRSPGVEGAAAAGDSEVGSAAERMVNDTLVALGVNPTVEVLLVVIVLAIVVKSILILLANRRAGYAVAQVATDLRLSLLRALLKTRWEYHVRQPIGSLANAMATEAHRSCKAYLRGVTMVALLLQVLVYVWVALLVSWKATLIALAAGMAILYALRRPVKKARQAGLRQTTLLKSLLRQLTDSLQSIKPLKAMARERLAESVLESQTKRLNKALRKQVFSREILRAYQECVSAVFLAIGLYVALRLWQLPLATVMVLTFLLVRLLSQLSRVQREYQQMVIFESAYWSLQETIQEAEAEGEEALGDTVPILKQGIRLDGVSFAYGQQAVLKDVTLEFPAGKITSIVGPSGSGKTTVANLVTGLARPKKGEIWIDDLPMSDIHLRSWRHMIGYVPQETLLLHESVLINVTLGDPELKEQDAEQALRAAGAWEFVQAMPEGSQTVVGERGGRLSGGQRQRIAIARALVHKPAFLILDEATSALDHENEVAICETLQQLRGKITILAISHRAVLIKMADRAYGLEDGRVVHTESSSEDGGDLQGPDQGMAVAWRPQ